MIECIVVGLGGMVGAVCRYLMGLIPLKEGMDLPVKTLAVNIIGAFAIGLIVAFAAKHPNLNPRSVLFLKTGVCGGSTTFSTAGDLVRAGEPTASVLYIVLSLVLGIGAVFAAQSIVK